MNRTTALALLAFLGMAAAHTHLSPDHRYAITAPDAWSVRPNIPGADVILNVPGSAGAINLITTVGQPLPEGMDLTGYAMATLDSLPGMMNTVKVTGDRSLTVAGLPARELLFTGRNRNGNRPVYGQVVLVVQAGRGYTLSYLGEAPRTAAARADIRRVLTSLTIKP